MKVEIPHSKVSKLAPIVIVPEGYSLIHNKRGTGEKPKGVLYLDASLWEWTPASKYSWCYTDVYIVPTASPLEKKLAEAEALVKSVREEMSQCR